VLGVTHPGDERLPSKADDLIVVPPTLPILNPVLMTIPLQMLAYFCAIELGRDVDQPRNLAKSVTVE
jgi:glucosamine--fructose-6-phosphate aminotransferase (isomerizing)